MATAHAALKPAFRPSPARFTADEFLHMGELGAFHDRRVELVDGVIVEKDLPDWLHSELHFRLTLLLGAALGREYQGMTEPTVQLGPQRVRQLDLAVVLRAARKPGPVTADAVVVAIEVSDTSLATDLLVKSVEYAAAGIPTYWVIDANAEVTHVMTGPGTDGYARRAVVRFREPLAVPGGGEVMIAP